MRPGADLPVALGDAREAGGDQVPRGRASVGEPGGRLGRVEGVERFGHGWPRFVMFGGERLRRRHPNRT